MGRKTKIKNTEQVVTDGGINVDINKEESATTQQYTHTDEVAVESENETVEFDDNKALLTRQLKKLLAVWESTNSTTLVDSTRSYIALALPLTFLQNLNEELLKIGSEDATNLVKYNTYLIKGGSSWFVVDNEWYGKVTLPKEYFAKIFEILNK